MHGSDCVIEDWHLAQAAAQNSGATGPAASDLLTAVHRESPAKLLSGCMSTQHIMAPLSSAAAATRHMSKWTA